MKRILPAATIALATPAFAHPPQASTPVERLRKTIDFISTLRMAGRLEHWRYDTFITRFDDTALEPAYVTFELDADGHVGRATMKPVNPIVDFSWDYQDLHLTSVEGPAK